MRNVLVVVDMQNDFVNQALGTEEAVQIVPAVIEEILKEKYDTVIATLDTHSEDYLSTLEGKYLPVIALKEQKDGKLTLKFRKL